MNRIAALVWCLFLITASAKAHVVSQLFAEVVDEGKEGWALEVLFDAGYADETSRNDPNSVQPSRDWLVALPFEDQRKLANAAARYLQEVVRIQSNGEAEETEVSFPDFDSTPPDFPRLLNDAAYFRVRMRVPSISSGSEIKVGIAEGKNPDLVLKVLAADGLPTYVTLHPGEMKIMKEGSSSMLEAFTQGVLHVIPKGLDHILFVLGVFFLRRRWRDVLTQSLAFTVAHTVTLGLAAAGYVAVSSAWVEPLIALSIAALAVENLLVKEMTRWRLGLVFAFGLVHGLGFAGVLSTWIRPGEGFVKALLAANLGVECAQVLVLSAAWVVTLRWNRSAAWSPFRKGANMALAAAGLWWFFERIL